MGFLDSFRKKKKARVVQRAQKVQVKQKAKTKSVVDSDVKFAHIMKEFGVLQKELQDVKKAMGMLRQAEERTFSEIQDHPIKLTAVIEREVGEISRRIDEFVSSSVKGMQPQGEAKEIRLTPLMKSITEVLDSGSMYSGEIYRKLLENDVRVHEKSVPRALKGLINNRLVKINSDVGGYKYEKIEKQASEA